MDKENEISEKKMKEYLQSLPKDVVIDLLLQKRYEYDLLASQAKTMAKQLNEIRNLIKFDIPFYDANIYKEGSGIKVEEDNG